MSSSFFRLDGDVYRVDRDAKGLVSGVFSLKGGKEVPLPGASIAEIEREGVPVESFDV